MLAIALLILLGFDPVTAQDDATMHGEEGALAVVHELFDAMREKDEARMRAVFHEDASLFSVANRIGEPELSRTPIEPFIRSIVSATVYLDEILWDEEVRVDANLATVWTPYRMMIDGNFSHCGVDAFQLIRLDEGWKIFHITDTRRGENCVPGGG